MKTSEEVIALEKACGSENLKLGAFLAGFGKTNGSAPTVAGLVCPRYYGVYCVLLLCSGVSLGRITAV